MLQPFFQKTLFHFFVFFPHFSTCQGYVSNSGPITITVEGLAASSEYETILYQYGGENPFPIPIRNTNGLLTLNNGNTVKVSGSYSVQNLLVITLRSLNQLMQRIPSQILQLKSVLQKARLSCNSTEMGKIRLSFLV